MVFSSMVFLCGFLPAVLIGYAICPAKYRNFFLFVASLFFYAWGEPRYIGIMLFSTEFDFCNGLLMEYLDRKGRPQYRKWVLVLSVVINIGILCFFKYTDFVLQSISQLTGNPAHLLKLALPIGISFYTFQTLSYTIDVYRREVEVQHNIIDFGMYVCLFPQLIAGPIVRYSDIQDQIKGRKGNWEERFYGVQRFILGLAKKVLLADAAGKVASQILDGSLASSTTVAAWLGILLYTFEIYFDFSGYSDMAIGMGRIFGFKYMENFRLPYTAKSITDFWRRWHISLSSFFRDYVYIPLGGKKKHRLLNMAIVWALTGMWHGASWNFVLWGLYFFVILAIEKQLGEKSMRRVPYLLRRLGTMLLIIFGWNIFYYTDMTRLVQNFGVMFGLYGAGFSNAQAGIQLTNSLPLLLLCAIGATSIPRNLGNLLGGVCAQGGKKSGQIIYAAVSFVFDAALLVLSTIALVGSTYNAFLYFRF